MRKFKLLSFFTAWVMLMVLFLSVPFHAIEQPVRAQEESTHEVVCTIPVGNEGVQYEGMDIPEMLPWGPAAFTIAPDGSFWIADTSGIRLLHYSAACDQLDTISLDGQVVGIGDVEVSASGVFVLDIAAVIPKVVYLTPDGVVLAKHELPEGLRLADGLSGIALGDQGEVLVEREGGAFVFQLLDASGKLALRPLNGYIHNGQLYRAQPADMRADDTTRGFIMVGDTRVEVTVPNSLGGLRVLGVNTH